MKAFPTSTSLGLIAWAKSIDGTFMSINSEEGVKQGELLGSALFNIGIHAPIIKRLNKILKPSLGVFFGCIIDFHVDINFIVNPAAFSDLRLWNKSNPSLSECGLSINMKNSSIYIPSSIVDIKFCHSQLPTDIYHQIERDRVCWHTYWQNRETLL